MPIPRRRHNRGGFTLLEIIIAITIIAIMAGAITPIVFNEFMAAKADATDAELAAIKKGLLDFYEDTGRFPTEGEGLAALVSDPGVINWQGPYVTMDRGNPADAVASDAFGNAYVYDVAPRTNPQNIADLIVASAGPNLTVNTGKLNKRWRLNRAEDDQLLLLTTGPVNRAKDQQCQAELKALSVGAREYYADHAAFPASLSDLAGNYVNNDEIDSNLNDPWETPYLTFVRGTRPQVFRIRSCGPNQRHNRGNKDDITVDISSVPPGRKTAQYRLDIAQAALNAEPGMKLNKKWHGNKGIRSKLGLSSIFDNDGWGRPFRINAGSRLIYSVGPDGRAQQVDDNIPTGVGP